MKVVSQLQVCLERKVGQGRHEAVRPQRQEWAMDVWYGKSTEGKARSWMARQGKARSGMVRLRRARLFQGEQGKITNGKARLRRARQSKARQGKKTKGKTRQVQDQREARSGLATAELGGWHRSADLLDSNCMMMASKPILESPPSNPVSAAPISALQRFHQR